MTTKSFKKIIDEKVINDLGYLSFITSDGELRIDGCGDSRLISGVLLTRLFDFSDGILYHINIFDGSLYISNWYIRDLKKDEKQ